MKKHLIILLLILGLASFLRLYKLNEVPVSLFGDELDVGYHAYSILKTGKDYSGNPWPIHFQSLAEWRTPLFLYSAVPTVAIFGISELGVRLPAAIFGILGVLAIYLLVKQVSDKTHLALIAATLLAISPWHLQYSRAAFEVTELLFFLLIGLFFFFKSLKSPKYLWLGVASLCLTPWIYSTAKLFTPFLFVFLFLTYRKHILKFSVKYLVFAILAGVVIGGPIAYSTIFGGGTARFNYISVFSDPTVEPEVGTSRLMDAQMRGEKGTGLNPTKFDRLIHNKFTFWGEKIGANYLQSLSTDFLFIEGDPNLRHSPKKVGQFYRVELLALIIGIIFFFARHKDSKPKLLIAFWILAGIIPASITRDGGNHATRLILILPPLVFLISYGIYSLINLPRKYSILITPVFGFVMFLSFFFYQHNYWTHYPWDSERWWHSGFKDAVQSIKENESDFDKIAISMASEPAWIFFAAWSEFDPVTWHEGYPFKKSELNGFGEISFIDKYYFGSPQGVSLYDWGKVLDKDTLYLASAREVPPNLIMEPERTPGDLNLIKAIAYPSGEPAFYLFSKK